MKVSKIVFISFAEKRIS